ncbi:MAG: archaeosine biosynthesis radical SAM protein RaSEA [Thermoplasmata archaeon]|jgi:radical SAM enzyme (TIGR01210 family)
MIDEIREIRSRTRREERPEDYVAVWSEYEPYKGRERSFVIVLRTHGCFWFYHSGCSMCGYFSDTNPSPVGGESLMVQVEKARKKYRGEKVVKIYNSGSFLDPREIDRETQLKIIQSFPEAERIIVETRPEFINEDTLQLFRDFRERLMIAIGLESSDENVLRKSINKGFTPSLFLERAGLARSMGFSIKTYILLKPPFLTESQAIEDSVKSAIFSSQVSDVISLNPVNVQNYTLVEKLWREGYYRPPWLWSVVEVLRRTSHLKRVVSFPTAPGSMRGAHNCRDCDDQVIRAIEDFSFTQDPGVLDNLPDCDCRRRWEKIIRYENLSFTTLGDQ